MGTTFYFGWEVALMEGLQAGINSIGVVLASALTMLGEEATLVAILGFLYWCYDKKFGKFIGTNIVVGITLNPMLKNMVYRRRPYMDHEGIQCLKQVKPGDSYDISVQGFSFPSGHSMNSAIVYGTLPVYKKNRLLTLFAFLFPFLIGISRVLLGVHYPTDVLTGWVVGAVTVFLLSFLQRKVKNIHILHLILFLLSVPGIFFCKTTDYFSAIGIMGGFFLADLFEEKVVKFENTKKVLPCVLRMVIGFALYFALNTLLKLPFPKEFLEAKTMAAFLVRAVRYLIVSFTILGLYPMLFKKLKFLS